MLKHNNLFDRFLNPEGVGKTHEFDLRVINGDSVVVDAASGLFWQKSGSLGAMSLSKAVTWIDELNSNKFADYDDWRLPTLEEAMGLMERTTKNGGLYIDPIFDQRQRWIWTSNRVVGAAQTWVVVFVNGSCYDYYLYDDDYVRAVRS